MALNAQQKRLRWCREVVEHTNRVIFETAQADGVLVADLVRFDKARYRGLGAARWAMIEQLQRTIVYRNRGRRLGREWAVAPFSSELERQGWNAISLPDLAILCGAQDHTSILWQRRKARSEARLESEVAA